MKLDSKYFDMVRIRRPEASGERVLADGFPCCHWKGCEEPGLHRAPKGRGMEGQYFLFCHDHIRQYNASYNYFSGMSDAEVEEFQKDAVTGHRPTWKVGANAWSHGTHRGVSNAELRRFAEARINTAQSFYAWRAQKARGEYDDIRRQLKPLEKRALEALGLSESANNKEIKSRFKELVKRHHPDSNGGDRASEDKLREIIQAYNYLKQAGLV
jgi:curved DNA-binding protein CbpA